MSDQHSALSPEALDFAPGLLSIQESPPGRLPRAVMYTVSSLFLILLLQGMGHRAWGQQGMGSGLTVETA